MTLQYTVQKFDDLNEVKMSRTKNHIFYFAKLFMILDNNHKMHVLIVLLIACLTKPQKTTHLVQMINFPFYFNNISQ